MTMILIDGFDHDDAVDVWTNSAGNSNSTSVKRTGTRSRSMGINQIQYRALGPTEVDDGMTLGSGVYMGSTNTDATRVMGHRFFEVASVEHINVVVYPPARSIQIWRGPFTTKLAETDPNILTWDTWHYIESGVKIADAGGTVEVRLNGATVLTYAGDTRNAGAGLVTAVGIIGNNFSAQACYFDDVYILNEQGASPWNTFLGDTRCFPLYPNGDGNYSQLVGSDGNSVNNSLLVDEVGTPSSTDYVGSVTPGDKDTYAFENMPVSVGTVRAVETRLYAAKSETGTKQMRPLIRRSGTDAAGADHVLAENAYATYRDIFQLDPITAAAWTLTNVDGSEFGAEVRA